MFQPGQTVVDLTPVPVVLEKVIDIDQGIQFYADDNNTANVFLGSSNVSNGSTPGSTGFPLGPGKGLFVPTEKVNEIFAISTSMGQILWYILI